MLTEALEKRTDIVWRAELAEARARAAYELDHSDQPTRAALLTYVLLNQVAIGFNPCCREVIDNVRTRFRPAGGWTGDNSLEGWLALLDRVVKALGSDKPLDALNIS